MREGKIEREIYIHIKTDVQIVSYVAAKHWPRLVVYEPFYSSAVCCCRFMRHISVCVVSAL